MAYKYVEQRSNRWCALMTRDSKWKISIIQKLNDHRLPYNFYALIGSIPCTKKISLLQYNFHALIGSIPYTKKIPLLQSSYCQNREPFLKIILENLVSCYSSRTSSISISTGANSNASFDRLSTSMFNFMYTCVIVRTEKKFRSLLIAFKSCFRWGALIWILLFTYSTTILESR